MTCGGVVTFWILLILVFSLETDLINGRPDELHIGGIFPIAGKGGWQGGQACMPAAKLALDDVNKKENLLPGFRLILHSNDSESAPMTFSHEELMHIPKCQDMYPPYRGHCITIQQPPKIMMRRKLVTTAKKITIPAYAAVPTTVCVPTITEKEKVVKVPIISWQTKMIQVPKIHWYPSYIPYPRIVCVPRTVIEPKEICQTILCQPKPQVIDIPAPNQFCCYETGPQTLRCSPPCPPCPPPPCSPYPPCMDPVMGGRML